MTLYTVVPRMARHAPHGTTGVEPPSRGPAYAIQCGVVTNFIKTRILKKRDKINFFGNNCKLTHKLPCHQSLTGFIFSVTKPEELVFAPHYNRRRPRQ
jgi:hypothetical protein